MRLFFVVLMLLFTTDCMGAINIWSDNIINKYRKDGEDGTSGTSAFTVKMARNEFEDMQILIYADGETLSDVDVSVSVPTKGTDTIDDVHLYLQWYLDTAYQIADQPPGVPTALYTQLGKWPDALIPKIDRYYGETRNKFPFSVPSGELQGVLIEFGTEFSEVAGTYACIATVSGTGSITGAFSTAVPITIVVWDITLPKEPTYHGQFYTFYSDIMYGHGLGFFPGWSTTTRQIYGDYEKFLIYHRLSNFSTNSGNPTWDGSNITFNWTEVDDFIIPSMDGSLITSGAYAGNVMKSTGIFNTHALLAGSGAAATTAYFQAWFDKFEAAGIDPMTRLFGKMKDEPGTNATTVATVAALVDAFTAVDTGGKGEWGNAWTTSKNTYTGGVQTTSLNTDGFYCPPERDYTCAYWIDYPDREVEGGDCVAAGSSSEAGILSGYPASKNSERWMYNACDSFGCTEFTAAASNMVGEQGWSALDVDGSVNRFFPLTMWLYRQTGIHYWRTTAMYCESNYRDYSGPFKTMYAYGVHGDGTLMYPGVVSSTGRAWAESGCHIPEVDGIEFIGGTHDIPIASIRLKYIRDGLEDLEIYTQAAEAGSVSTIDTLVNAKFSDPNPNLAYWKGDMTASNIISVREDAAELLTGAAETGLKITTGTGLKIIPGTGCTFQ